MKSGQNWTIAISVMFNIILVLGLCGLGYVFAQALEQNRLQEMRILDLQAECSSVETRVSLKILASAAKSLQEAGAFDAALSFYKKAVEFTPLDKKLQEKVQSLEDRIRRKYLAEEEALITQIKEDLEPPPVITASQKLSPHEVTLAPAWPQKQSGYISDIKVTQAEDVKRPPKSMALIEKVLFEDDFTDSRQQWYTKDTEYITASIKDGKYSIWYKYKEGGWSDWKAVPLYGHEDFCIECTMQKRAGVNDGNYGITWGGDGRDHSYLFLINGNGMYFYGKIVDGTWHRLIPHKKSIFVNKGASENKLMVRKKGDVIEFYINDKLADAANFEPFMGNMVGLYVAGSQVVEFDHLVVRQFYEER